MTDQEEFDKIYITSMEVCRELGISRASLVQYRRRKQLPLPIEIVRPEGVPYLLIWKRAELTPILADLKLQPPMKPGRRPKEAIAA